MWIPVNYYWLLLAESHLTRRLGGDAALDLGAAGPDGLTADRSPPSDHALPVRLD